MAPVAWAALSLGVLTAGCWFAGTDDVFGHAVFTHVWTSALLLLVGALGLLASVASLRTRVRVHPDRLAVTRGLRRTRTVRPGELVRIAPSGKGNDRFSGATARGRGFTSDRFHRHHDALADWLARHASEPWTAYSELLGQLTHREKPASIRHALSMLSFVALFVVMLLMAPGLSIIVAYDDVHQEEVTCTITSARTVTGSTRSLRGIGSSYPAVAAETSDCGPLTLRQGVHQGNQDALARALDGAPGPHRVTVGAASLWIRDNVPWSLLAPTVYGIDLDR